MSYSSQYSHYNRKSPQKGRWKRFIMLVVVVLTAALIFFLIREVKRNPVLLETASDYGSRVKSWVIERKQNLNQTVANVKKQVGERDENDRVVNFEFYNTLQDMKSMQVDATAKMNQSLEAKAKAAEKLAAAAPPPKPKKVVKITQAADLEKDLLSAIKQPRGGK